MVSGCAEVLRTLINCWQHFANVNYTTAHSGTGAGRHNHTLNEVASKCFEK